MKHGFIKVATATNQIKVADTLFNSEKIIELIKEAENNNVKVLCFPELSITGATCGDLYNQEELLSASKKALIDILDATNCSNCLTFVSLPLKVRGNLYIVACAMYNGEILGFIPKTNLSIENKRIFKKGNDEAFDIDFNGKSYPFGTNLIFEGVGAEGFLVSCEIGIDRLALISPSTYHAMNGASIIVNPSSDSACVNSMKQTKKFLKALSERLKASYITVNAGLGESTGDKVYSGYSIICENGEVLKENEPFKKGLSITEIDADYILKERMKVNDFNKAQNYKFIKFNAEKEETVLSRKIPKNPFLPDNEKNRNKVCEEALRIQTEGLKKRISHTNAKALVIGVSGGLDSCLALLVAHKALKELGRSSKDIVAITMPCFGTTERTKGNAEKLCELLDTEFITIDIKDSVVKHFEDIGHKEEIMNVVYENAQARERTQILMDIANARNGMVIGTGDLSELALGWATYNGDHMSMYGVNGAVPKTAVRGIVSFVKENTDSQNLKEVLEDILKTPVSPELLPCSENEITQKTEELVGPYELHDFFLYYFIKYGFTVDKIKKMALHAFDGIYDEKEVDYWLKTFIKRFFTQQFKRSCLPDGPKVFSIGLSPRGEFNMPSDASYSTWFK